MICKVWIFQKIVLQMRWKPWTIFGGIFFSGISRHFRPKNYISHFYRCKSKIWGFEFTSEVRAVRARTNYPTLYSLIIFWISWFPNFPCKMNRMCACLITLQPSFSGTSFIDCVVLSSFQSGQQSTSSGCSRDPIQFIVALARWK